ncbi:MAG TPA: hypothetical protein PK951_03850 [Chitinophagaceae bacterium]|nr:hypothetical protein [Chitinophagaceae bacterium]
MIALWIAKAKQAFFQNRVFPIPQGDAETQVPKVIGNTGQAIFTPEISPAMGVIKWKIMPGIPVDAIVLTGMAPIAPMGSLYWR